MVTVCLVALFLEKKKRISLEFKITGLSSTSTNLMKKLVIFFNCGRIAIDNRRDNTIKFVITDIKSILNNVIPLASRLINSLYKGLKN